MIKVAGNQNDYNQIDSPNQVFVCFFYKNQFPQTIIHNRENRQEYWCEDKDGSITGYSLDD